MRLAGEWWKRWREKQTVIRSIIKKGTVQYLQHIIEREMTMAKLNPADLLAWIQAIKALIELLKELFGDDEGKEVAKGIIRTFTTET